ncbi:hypothetical protein EGW08_013934 [Elysia chlorotica]|uniref:Endonuclease/exonuclease/phosphatase domain-containing protein n=1 Tax=Elysia chlorotica TaxID=188477 RepID=A0A3S1HFG5_ELYCH|nr:hypothetical protein EGW08_013934 [Elysia chlorotica]
MCVIRAVLLLVFTVSQVRSNTSPSIRIGTFNIWNVMFNWKERLQYIASVIKEQEIDIIAFQEVRFSTDKSTGLIISQLEEVKKYLQSHKWMVAQPAGPAGKPAHAYWKEWDQEGLGVLSKFPIRHFANINITSERGKDPNSRLALHVQIQVKEEPQQVINVVAVHYSYAKKQQCQNTQHILDYLSSTHLDNIIMLGDFNAYPEFSGPVEAFIFPEATSCEIKLPYVPLFRDVVLEKRGSDPKAPLTFSNMPSPGLVSRPDRILVSPSIKEVNYYIYGHGAPYRNRFYSAIVMNRVESVLRSAVDSFLGKAGYSCLHDCGPHGSCRCGVCVQGGNELNCNIPECEECDRGSFILFIVILFPMLLSLVLLMFFVIRTLVVSANFNQEDLFAILGYRCCLFNAKLFRYRSLPRTLRSVLGRASVLWRLPPLPMVLVSLTVSTILSFLFMMSFLENFKYIYSILPEELFPSDHLMVVAEISLLDY